MNAWVEGQGTRLSRMHEAQKVQSSELFDFPPELEDGREKELLTLSVEDQIERLQQDLKMIRARREVLTNEAERVLQVAAREHRQKREAILEQAREHHVLVRPDHEQILVDRDVQMRLHLEELKNRLLAEEHYYQRKITQLQASVEKEMRESSLEDIDMTPPRAHARGRRIPVIELHSRRLETEPDPDYGAESSTQVSDREGTTQVDVFDAEKADSIGIYEDPNKNIVDILNKREAALAAAREQLVDAERRYVRLTQSQFQQLFEKRYQRKLSEATSLILQLQKAYKTCEQQLMSEYTKITEEQDSDNWKRYIVSTPEYIQDVITDLTEDLNRDPKENEIRRYEQALALKVEYIQLRDRRSLTQGIDWQIVLDDFLDRMDKQQAEALRRDKEALVQLREEHGVPVDGVSIAEVQEDIPDVNGDALELVEDDDESSSASGDRQVA